MYLLRPFSHGERYFSAVSTERVSPCEIKLVWLHDVLTLIAPQIQQPGELQRYLIL
jgi:hypothetical protein